MNSEQKQSNIDDESTRGKAEAFDMVLDRLRAVGFNLDSNTNIDTVHLIESLLVNGAETTLLKMVADIQNTLSRIRVEEYVTKVLSDMNDTVVRVQKMAAETDDMYMQIRLRVTKEIEALQLKLDMVKPQLDFVQSSIDRIDSDVAMLKINVNNSRHNSNNASSDLSCLNTTLSMSSHLTYQSPESSIASHISNNKYISPEAKNALRTIGTAILALEREERWEKYL